MQAWHPRIVLRNGSYRNCSNATGMVLIKCLSELPGGSGMMLYALLSCILRWSSCCGLFVLCQSLLVALYMTCIVVIGEQTQRCCCGKTSGFYSDWSSGLSFCAGHCTSIFSLGLACWIMHMLHGCADSAPFRNWTRAQSVHLLGKGCTELRRTLWGAYRLHIGRHQPWLDTDPQVLLALCFLIPAAVSAFAFQFTVHVVIAALALRFRALAYTAALLLIDKVKDSLSRESFLQHVGGQCPRPSSGDRTGPGKRFC